MFDEIVFPSYLFSTEIENKKDTPPLAFLADKQMLKELVSRLCRQLHHPVSLIDYNALVHAEEPEKLESVVEMYPMRRACSVFRKCAGSGYCSLCDRFHARFMDTDKESIEKNIKSNIDQTPSFFYPEYKHNPPKVLEGFERQVIEYHCPMLGYRELLFPLKYKAKIFGVIFAGQILVYGRGDNEIKNYICNSFFNSNNPEELFKTFVDRYNASTNDKYGRNRLNYEVIKNLIMVSDDDERIYEDVLGFRRADIDSVEYYSKDFKSSDDYLAFINNVCKAIAHAEMLITEAYRNRVKTLIPKVLGQITNTFFDEYEQVHSRSFKNKHELRTEELKSSWMALKVFSKEILEQFKPVKKIILFGDAQGINIEDSSKKVIVFSVPEERNLKGTFDFSFYNIDGISDYTNSMYNPDILNGLSEELPKENRILVQCHDIAMLMLVDNLDEHNEFFIDLADAIGKELVRINNVIALCSANLTKERYLLTLRMYRHENAHISTRLMGNINRYFDNNGKRFVNTDEKKRQLVCNDMKNTVQLLSNIASNIGFVTGSKMSQGDPSKDTTNFDVIGMLCKWRAMFHDELISRNLEINVFRGHDIISTGSYRPIDSIIRVSEITRDEGICFSAPREIIINGRLFELLVYNLVDNAVKYAYRGTNIYLIWGQIDDLYELSVTSYGPLMPEGEEMYELYVRGKDERLLQGDGLGLYVVKKIAEILNLKLDHDSEKISDYNAPLIPWYCKTDFSNIKAYSKIDEQKLTLNNNEKQLLFAINTHASTKIKEADLTLDYLRLRIKMETWRTTFRVKIPMNNGLK